MPVYVPCDACYEEHVCMFSRVRFRAEDEQTDPNTGRPLLPLWYVDLEDVCVRCYQKMNSAPFNERLPAVVVPKKQFTSTTKKVLREMKRLDVPNGMIGNWRFSHYLRQRNVRWMGELMPRRLGERRRRQMPAWLMGP
jgi:hypothetical protein